MSERAAKGTGTKAAELPRPGSLVSAVERAGRAAGRRTPSDGAVGDDVRSARAALSIWLAAGREARGWSRDHVARVTRIPMRTVENLEDGRWDELPADVFVRGFLRSYARCVGLSVDDALAQYSGCGFAAAPVASAQARALLDSMAPLAPLASAPRGATSTPITSQPRILSEQAAGDSQPGDSQRIAVASIQRIATSNSQRMATVTEPSASDSLTMAIATIAIAAPTESLAEGSLSEAPGGRRRHKRAATVTGGAERDARGRFVRKSVQMAAVVPEPDAIADTAIESATASTATAATRDAGASGSLEIEIITESAVDAPVAATPAPVAAPIVTAPVAVAPIATSEPVRVTPPSVRISAIRRAAPSVPSLVIDDDDPEDAERAREHRAQQQKDGGWRSFLPPALLDQERGGRQGGLTLAVIILLIVATLTLSYLMRRPSSTGEGVTEVTPSHLVA